MCKQWKKYNESVIMNLPDSGKKSEEDTVYLTVDMQKVIMLSRIPGVITAVFRKILIVFHGIFVPLGDKSRGKPFGVV